MNNINLICPINKLGYGTIGRNILPILRKMGVIVSLFPIGNVQVDNAEEKEAVLWAIENAKLFDSSAPSVKIWHQHDMAQRVGNGKAYGFPIFELDTFSPQEINSLSSVSVINCSKWAEEICRANGVFGLAGIVPLGYNEKVFRPGPIPKTDTLRIFNMGKWEIRKGHDVLPDIFRSAFSPSDNVELFMLNDNPFYSPEENKSWRDFYTHKLRGYGYKVTFIDRVETQQEVAAIINNCHCGFFPTRAEGWNLEALETLACGRKLVTTKYSGHTEFTNGHYDSFDLEPAIDGKWFHGQGKWLKIDDEVYLDLVNQLKAIKLEFDSGPFVVQNLAENFTWLDSAKKLCEVVGVDYVDVSRTRTTCCEVST